jgi:hypothetical protein
MNMRNKKNVNTKAILAGAAMAAVLPAFAMAAPTVTVTNLGTPTNATPVTATGYTAYDISLGANAGDNIVSVDMGGTNGTSGNGIFGTLLQEWTRTTSTQPYAQTPVKAGQESGSGFGLDSHIVASTALVLGTPAEDQAASSNPGSPIPATTATKQYGEGTYIHGVFGFATNAPTEDLAYIVVPNNTLATYTITIGENPTGGGTATTYTETATIQSATSPTHAIISLTSSAPSGYGSSQGNFDTVGSNGHYGVSTVAVSPSANLGYVGQSGAFTASDTQIYGFEISDTSNGENINTELGILEANVNSGALSGPADTTASLSSPSAALPSYDNFFLTITSPETTSLTSPDLGWDVTKTNDTNLTDNLVVESVSAVPEPASIAGVVFGAAGLLLNRRKRKA